MKNPFLAFLPHSQRHLLMGRLATSAQPPSAVPGVEILAIHRAADPAAQSLDAFATANGFPSGWTRDMLADGARAVVARDPASGELLAMGWSTRQPFHVDEIAATLNPGQGVYLFGDFVAPAHRGRKLQKLLISHRLTELDDRPFACTLVEPANLASLRSYTAEGFSIGGQYVRHRWRSRTWTRCKPVRNAAVTFELPSCDIVLARRA